MKYAEFDLSRLPFVVMTINPVMPSLEEFKRDYLDIQEKLVREKTNMIWIIKAKHIKLLPSEHRIAAGVFIKQNIEQLKLGVRVAFLVEASFWTQMMLNAITLIIKSPVPFHVCSNMDDALLILRRDYGIDLKMTE
jgi:hypothetical protein